MRTVALLTLLVLASLLVFSFGEETIPAGKEEKVGDAKSSGEGTEQEDVAIEEDSSGSETSDSAGNAEEVIDLDAKESEEVEPEPAESGSESDTASDEDGPAPTTDDVVSKNASGTEEGQSEVGKEEDQPVQSGPFIDLFGESLLSLQMIDEKQAQIHAHYTNEALSGKKVIGLYFSADWCGPCRQFTPDLVNFYNKMNSRRGKEKEFEIVWISRCRDVDSFGQYFTHMNWLALPPQEAMGQRGQMLSEKYKVKGIPTLVLLDEVGNTITTDGRNKIPMDKAGIGFPWRNPLATIYMTIVPKSLRLMLKTHVNDLKEKVLKSVKRAKVARA